MYQFKYQTTNPYDFYPPEELIFTCIVPDNWLSKDLPTVGVCVNYTAKREQLVSCGSVVFEFSDVTSTDETARTIRLDILQDGVKCFQKPIEIHCPKVAPSELGDECCIEVLLLNHLFGCNAISAWVAVDFADFIGIMEKSSTYYFQYGIGKTPSDILPDILEPAANRDVKCEFVMMFCDNQKMRLEYLREIMDAMSSSSTDESIDSLGLVCAVGVEQDEMLISVLVGC
jgi:hypothetical protein